ncbi:predicted protein [Brucella suis bv. 3 str. 686]|nr:predicted protein [Brucella suis bv. 4 str. 40]EEY31949.1 predicted protein [Brucella suis bv. 3 str. 686]
MCAFTSTKRLRLLRLQEATRRNTRTALEEDRIEVNRYKPRVPVQEHHARAPHIGPSGMDALYFRQSESRAGIQAI